MVYKKPLVCTMGDDELADMIAAGACSVYSNNCSCGGYHCPGNSGNSGGTSEEG